LEQKLSKVFESECSNLKNLWKKSFHSKLIEILGVRFLFPLPVGDGGDDEEPCCCAIAVAVLMMVDRERGVIFLLKSGLAFAKHDAIRFTGFFALAGQKKQFFWAEKSKTVVSLPPLKEKKPWKL
jgi:hypothetical protein